MTALQKQEDRFVQVTQYLEKRKREIAKILPPELPPERVIKTAIVAMLDSPDIARKCTPLSIYRSILQASLLGLTVGGGNPEAYLVPRNDQCTLMVDYRGWAKCARRSPGVDIIRAATVYENDRFYAQEFPPALHHEPAYGKPRGELVGAIAAAYTRQGDGSLALYDFAFVSHGEIEQARSMAGPNSPAWKKWYDEMAKKTAIRRLCKLLPLNPDLQRLQSAEAAADDGRPVYDIDIDEALEAAPAAPKAQGRTTQLKERLQSPPQDGAPPEELPEPEIDYGNQQ